VIGPLLLVVGGVNTKGASPNILSGSMKLVIVVSALFTTSVVIIVAPVLFNVLAWVAVIVTVPTPTIVTTSAATVAINVFEDV
jgi:hypothetical protein